MKPVRGSRRRIRRLVAVLAPRFSHQAETRLVVHSIQIIRTTSSFRSALAKGTPDDPRPRQWSVHTQRAQLTTPKKRHSVICSCHVSTSAGHLHNRHSENGISPLVQTLYARRLINPDKPIFCRISRYAIGLGRRLRGGLAPPFRSGHVRCRLRISEVASRGVPQASPRPRGFVVRFLPQARSDGTRCVRRHCTRDGTSRSRAYLRRGGPNESVIAMRKPPVGWAPPTANNLRINVSSSITRVCVPRELLVGGAHPTLCQQRLKVPLETQLPIRSKAWCSSQRNVVSPHTE